MSCSFKHFHPLPQFQLLNFHGCKYNIAESQVTERYCTRSQQGTQPIAFPLEKALKFKIGCPQEQEEAREGRPV